MSLRSRLLAAALILVAFGLVAADFATYSALRSFLYNRVDDQLAAAHQSVERALFTRDGAFAAASLRQLGTVVPGVYVQVLDETGQVLVTVEGRGPNRSSTPDLPANVTSLVTDTNGGGTGSDESADLLTVPSQGQGGPDYRIRVSSLPEAGTLVVGLPLGDTAETLHHLLTIELLVTGGVFVVAIAGGLWLVRLGLRPLAAIEGTAAEITAGDLSHRVERADENTEVGRLGKALNVMLDEIDTAFAERRTSEEAARSSEERMRRFVADAAHELRTPVAAVRAYAELYRRGADERPEDLARILARIEQEATRVGVLVDDLLLLTRLDQARPLERVPVDLGAVAGDAVETFRAVDPRRPITLDVTDSVEVRGDRDRLRQVVDNLLSNVRSHTPAGSAVDVRVEARDGRAVLEVADRGPGLDPETADRVFERFYRADPARSRDHGGVGLGLAIVDAITRALGGEASAEPRPGGGAVFRVSFPVLEDASEPPKDEPETTN